MKGKTMFKKDNYKNMVLLNAEIPLLIALVCLIIMILFTTKCAQERTDPHYKRINVEDTKSYRNNAIYDPCKVYKDSIAILKDQIRMKDLMLDQQKDYIQEINSELRKLRN